MFDTSFQRSVLRLALQDDAFAAGAFMHLEPSFFTTEALGWLFKVSVEYWKEYHRRISEAPLRHELRKLPADKVALYSGEVEFALTSGAVLEAEYVKRELREFVRMSIFAEGHRVAAEHFNQQAYAKAYEVMAQAQDRIQRVAFEKPKRQWLFDELHERQARRIRDQMNFKQQPRMTGIDDLDKLTDGGVHEGELWCVFAYAKRCKTTWLINQGFHSTRVHRQPTLHIQLEGLAKQTADKYDACFSRELYTKVKSGDFSTQNYIDLYNEYQTLRGLMVIRTINDWDVTVEHIVAELDELKATRGFEPTTVIVDYMDLLRSRNKRVDSETQHQIDAARDLKRLVNDREIAAWSAWQAQRPKKGAMEKEHVLTSADVADAYAKVRIVDAYGSLNATDEEMERGEMRIFWEGHRDAPVGKLYRIYTDLKTMRMIEHSEVVVPNVPPAAVGAS